MAVITSESNNAALIEALTEIYVIPKAREKKRAAILALKSEIEDKKKPT